MDLCYKRMEKEIIKELLEKYGLQPYDNVVDVYLRLIQLGFNNIWLRNIAIIKQFDELYKTDTPTMEIYGTIAMDNKDLSVNQVRKVIRDRKLYEI